MTTKDFMKRLLYLCLFICVLSAVLSCFIAIKGVPDSAKVAYRRIENKEIEFDGSINLICPKCGYPKEHWVRMILTDDGQVDSTRSGIFPKGR